MRRWRPWVWARQVGMAYRSLVEEIPESLKQTVLRTFNFRGRSRRTDGVVYYILASMLGAIVGVPVIASSLDFNQVALALRLLGLVIQLPLLAWLVRRAHDYNVSGFWLLPLMGVFAFIVASQWSAVDVSDLRANLAFRVAQPVFGIALLCAVFWNPTDGHNRFGPDPRLDPSDEEIDQVGEQPIH